MEDKELNKILDKLLIEFILHGKIRRKEENRLVKLKRITATSPHGIYVYDKASDVWVLKYIEGEEFKPWKDGYYAIYFDNTLCPACKVYDLVWFPYVSLVGRKLEDTEFVVVLCEWFSRRCRSSAAAKSFEKYNIHVSPTTVLLKVENNVIVKREDIRGAKPLDVLIKKIDSFRSSA
ncbi:hypothetical protein [Stetteria hydrogenophila]